MKATNTYITNLETPRFPWQRTEALKMAEKLKTEVTYTNGIVRWQNGNLLPTDLAEFAAYLKLPVNLKSHEKARNEDLTAFAAAYHQNQKPPTAEELYEMRAAFGPGATVVDIISGQKIQV
jgi:hypothetical protein